MHKINRLCIFTSLTILGIGVLIIGTWNMQRVMAAPKLDTWFSAQPLPAPLAANLVQCVDDPNRFYMVGGIAMGFTTSNELLRYDISAQYWVSLADMPAPRRAVAAACYQGKIYVAGGWALIDSTDSFFIYDISTDTWLPGPDLPESIWAAALGAWDGKLYLVGGNHTNDQNCTPVDYVDVYDITNGIWTPDAGKSMPVASACFGSIQIGPYLYVVGGASGDLNSNVNQTQRYDMAADQWELGPQFTSARALGMLSATASHLYMLGGDVNGGTLYEPTDLVESLDLSTWPNGTWEDIGDPLPAVNILPASTCSEALTGGEIWAVGGTDVVSVYDTNYYKPAEQCVSFGIDLPEPWKGAGKPGTTNEYMLSITNTAVVTDFYALEITTTWQINTVLSQPTPIGPGESIPFVVVVDIPADAKWGDWGITEIKAISFSNPAAGDTTSITTTVLGYEFDAQAIPSDALEGHPGEVLTYTIQATNIGDFEDSYNIEISATWPTDTPISIGPIQPAMSTEMNVLVHIPTDINHGERDDAIIMLISQQDPRVSHSIKLTSTAVWHRMLIPLTMKN